MANYSDIVGSISIHALREEGDTTGCVSWPPRAHFYPRPPRGGRPGSFSCTAYCAEISIHALREEGDRCNGQCTQDPGYFYPRPPRGGRLWAAYAVGLTAIISIHALREEGDAFFMPWVRALPEFLSTPSARRATRKPALSRNPSLFLSTPSARRATRRSCEDIAAEILFLSTPSARRATVFASAM